MTRPFPSSVLVSVLAALLLVTAAAPAAVPALGLAAAGGWVAHRLARPTRHVPRGGRHLRLAVR